MQTAKSQCIAVSLKQRGHFSAAYRIVYMSILEAATK